MVGVAATAAFQRSSQTINQNTRKLNPLRERASVRLF
jgi:hypothetical protein